MKHINIFLKFPQNDEEILELGDDISLYEDIPKQLILVKSLMQKGNYTLFYDSEDVETFCDKAASIGNKVYLDKIRVKLFNLLTKTAVNVRKEKFFKSDCFYYIWNDNHVSIDANTNDIIKSVAEYRSLKAEEESVIVSFLYNDKWHRDIVPVITEAKHYSNLPVLNNIPYFSPSDNFVVWYGNLASNRAFTLSDVGRFERTNRCYAASKQRIYKEKATGRYWYYDYFHKDNKEHYEVFDSVGGHVGEADMNGNVDETKKDNSKRINV